VEADKIPHDPVAYRPTMRVFDGMLVGSHDRFNDGAGAPDDRPHSPVSNRER
jgi:hypothetical protein